MRSLRATKRIAQIGRIGGSLALGLVLTELALFALTRSPFAAARAPANLRAFLRDQYNDRRAVLQTEPAFARYDSRLYYTLRPGRFTFANLEFVTDFAVNSLGTRDTETALARPEVVVVGDSFAAGWGVGQDESFPALLGAALGKRVLNAAVPSYGTARELLLLDRVELGSVRTLVVQYCGNDFDENREYQEAGNRYVAPPETEYSAAQRHYLEQRRYTPFRLTRAAVAELRTRFYRWRKGLASPDRPLEGADEMARAFLNALVHASPRAVHKMNVVVLDPNPDPSFLRALERLRGEARYPPFVRRLRTLDLSAGLTADKYFALDDHLNRAGHRYIAEQLAKTLKGSR